MPETAARSRAAWRIANDASLDGAGGLRAPGRWHSRGRPIVYLAESPPGALLEVLVHLEIPLSGPLPDRYTLMRIEIPTEIELQELAAPPPESGFWRLSASQALGDRWLHEATSPLLRVPSAIVPEAYNLLLNPAHPHASRVRMAARFRASWDARLLAQRSARRSSVV